MIVNVSEKNSKDTALTFKYFSAFLGFDLRDEVGDTDSSSLQ